MPDDPPRESAARAERMEGGYMSAGQMKIPQVQGFSVLEIPPYTGRLVKDGSVLKQGRLCTNGNRLCTTGRRLCAYFTPMDPKVSPFFCLAIAIHLGRHIRYLNASVKLVDSIARRDDANLSPFLTF